MVSYTLSENATIEWTKSIDERLSELDRRQRVIAEGTEAKYYNLNEYKWQDIKEEA